MNVLVFAGSSHGNLKKSAFEGVTYAHKWANSSGGSIVVLTTGVSETEAQKLGDYGAQEVLLIEGSPDNLGLTDALSAAVQEKNINTIFLAYDVTGRHLAPRLSARLKAGLVSGSISIPEKDGDSLTVKKNVFSGKAIASISTRTPVKIISFSPNSLAPEKKPGNAVITSYNPPMRSSRIKKLEVKEKQGEISLPDAEIVVSGGRGLKGPENWHIIEDLANALGAATACSRPVADIGWRPHHEHVGQTGILIRPNLYIAIGISGAIQHLAGVNQSKVIVVINKDPEAPFFKAADYGIVGDAFEVVPKITEAIKKIKAAS